MLFDTNGLETESVSTRDCHSEISKKPRKREGADKQVTLCQKDFLLWKLSHFFQQHHCGNIMPPPSMQMKRLSVCQHFYLLSAFIGSRQHI